MPQASSPGTSWSWTVAIQFIKRLPLLAALMLAAPDPMTRGAVAPAFDDITVTSGVVFRHYAAKTAAKLLPETMGAGVALLDYDQDGLLDLYFVNGAASRTGSKAGTPEANRLFRNSGDGKFSDVTNRLGLSGNGYGMGAAVGDFNGDGYPDLYVTGVGRNYLYRNNRGVSFTEVAVEAGVAGSGWSTSAVWVDYDRDGLLDLVVGRYLDWDWNKNYYCGDRKPGYRSYCHPDLWNAVPALVFRNEGNGKFADASVASGVAAHPGKVLGIAVDDFDQDGWPDLLFANDSAPQQFFRNSGDGRFEERGLATGVAYNGDGSLYAGMGIDAADYNRDGNPDVFINALAQQRYALFRNTGKLFEDETGRSGIGRLSLAHSGWGAKFADFDLDGWKDLIVAQSHVMDNIELTSPGLRYREELMLLRNRNGKFENAAAEGGPAFQRRMAARGLALGDVNNDGVLDVVVSCNDDAPRLLRGRRPEANSWLLVKLVGRKSNRDGIGAIVRLTGDGAPVQRVYVTAGGSYLSSSDSRAHFGWIESGTKHEITIEWPSGKVQRVPAEPRSVMRITEPE